MDEYKEISLKELLICIWDKIWIIALATVVFGLAAFTVTEYMIAPKYEATISMYVNNKTEMATSLTTSDVAAAKSLVDTYITIIESNSVLNDVAANAKFECTPGQIKQMMSAKALNSTEVFEVSITTTSPEKSVEIANLLADLAPNKITEIVDGSSVKIIDRATMPIEPVSPSLSKNIAIACLLGFVLSCFTAVLRHMLDTTIYSEEDIKEFCKLPVLGIFSDFNQVSASKYGYAEDGRSAGK